MIKAAKGSVIALRTTFEGLKRSMIESLNNLTPMMVMMLLLLLLLVMMMMMMMTMKSFIEGGAHIPALIEAACC